MDCGLICLKMISQFYSKHFSLENLRVIAEFEKTGVSMYGIKMASEKLGFESEGLQLSIGYFDEMLLKSPIILHWSQNHFVVVYKKKGNSYRIADPAKGIRYVSEKEVINQAFSKNEANQLIAQILVLKPTDFFYSRENDKDEKGIAFKFIVENLKRYKSYFILIFWAMFLGLFIQFLIPFFTKAIVDKGIGYKDIDLVKLFILGQGVLILSSTLFTILRSWISAHLSTRISFSLISSFLEKMFKLPLTFFETRKAGDILQRIGDQSRIESFLTKTSISVIFSLLMIVGYSFILGYYNYNFLLIFLGGVLFYVLWTLIFLKTRQKIDWRRFEYSAKSQSLLIQLINGVHDLKINNAQSQYFEKWEINQVDYYKNSFKSLKLYQYQETGAELIFQLFQLGLTYLSVKLVIEGQLTIGQMLSIQFILGQLVSPVEQIIGAIMFGQDAKMSYGRLFDIWRIKEEKSLANNKFEVPREGNLDIVFKQVSFEYSGQQNNLALSNLSLKIPTNKITAIVGLSGSGKTTILKLLLGYYYNYNGIIEIGGINFKDLEIDKWRSLCGAVLQESFIFNETIMKNIIMDYKVDEAKYKTALKIANIEEYINSLPVKGETLIGTDGKGLSFGQRQRILIARAVYKDPSFIFFDEATNSLDAENEDIIIGNLKTFFAGRTVLLIAHRLSTIQFADNIIVLEKGKIVEQGNHTYLINQKGRYFDLIRKQIVNS